jgi:tRNA(His) 5'-end guanylyltransferase
MSKDALGDRMKDYYESRTKYKLPRRTNTIIRLDGKAFHTFTRGFEKPFDKDLSDAMDKTAKALCENIQGAVMAYVQSDEITILLTDYSKITTDAWFDGNIQKIASISASMATAYFNEYINKDDVALALRVFDGKERLRAFFDSRVFTIPDRGEVINCFLWRQQDAVRNSVSMVAQSLYPHKELMNKNQSDMQEMCWQKGVNWNNIPDGWKRGRMIIKDEVEKSVTEEVGESLKKKNDERLVWNDGSGYAIRTFGWLIKPAIDFNQYQDNFRLYLEAERNYDFI